MKWTINFLIVITLFSVSCTKDQPSKIETPEFYTFSRNGQSTVDFNGQTTRLLMAEELVNAMTDFDRTAELLSDMFGNTNNPFEDQNLNTSDKSIKSKVAASNDYFSSNTSASAKIKNQFENWLSSQMTEISPASEQLAEAGKPGQIADGSSTRYINAKGLEYNQAFAKSLIGAMMTDQMLNHYLSISILDEGNNRNDNDQSITVEGKSYTTMEHKWDEAYGYLFGKSQSSSDPLATLGDDSFLNKYLSRVNDDPDFNTIAQDIFKAFKLGRAAIVAGDYEMRNEQAELIKELVSTVIGVRAVYYLQQGKNAIQREELGSAFHGLSEGFGFIYSLQFTRQPNTSSSYFSAEEVQSFLSDLQEGNGFWEVSSEKLDEISAAIADRFNFSLEQAAE